MIINKIKTKMKTLLAELKIVQYKNNNRITTECPNKKFSVTPCRWITIVTRSGWRLGGKDWRGMGKRKGREERKVYLGSVWVGGDMMERGWREGRGGRSRGRGWPWPPWWRRPPPPPSPPQRPRWQARRAQGLWRLPRVGVRLAGLFSTGPGWASSL